MIGGIILSAGESKRMGEPKALLKIGKTIFVNHIIEVLCGANIKEIVTVLGHNYKQILENINRDNTEIVINYNYKEGQLSSLISGLEFFQEKDVEGVIVCLVDHPLLSENLVKSMVDAFKMSGKKIVVPVYRGKRGHPVIFSRSIFEQIRNASPEVGAREVLWKNKNDVFELETDDESVLIGINTPEDYKKFIKNTE